MLFTLIFVWVLFPFSNAYLLHNRLYSPNRKSTTVTTFASPKVTQNDRRMKDKLKVLLLVEPTPFNYVSGYANRFKEMLKHLTKYGDDVQIVTPDPDPNPPDKFLEFPITTLKGFQCPYYNHVTLSIDTRFRTGKILKTFKPDILHVSTPSLLIFPAIYWARKYKIPLVMSFHTNMVEYSKTYLTLIPPRVLDSVFKSYMKMTHKFADLILCTSPQLKESMEEMGLRRIDIWQKGINTEIYSKDFKSLAMRKRLSDGHIDKPLLLFVGRLGYEKRLDRLKVVLDRNPGMRLALIGTGPAEKYLKTYFKDYPVHFAGQLVGEPLSQAFASSDVFVMPSDTETLGFVLLESLASGVPVVGVAAGGVVDVIDHGKTGYLASNSDNMTEFSEYVGKLARDEKLRNKLGNAGIKWAQGWSWETATEKLRNVQYRKAIDLHANRDAKGRHSNEVREREIMSSSSYEI